MILGLKISFTIVMPFRTVLLKIPILCIIGCIWMHSKQNRPMIKDAETTCISSSGTRRPIL